MHGLRLVYGSCLSRKPSATYVHEVVQGVLVHGDQLYARVHHRLPAEVETADIRNNNRKTAFLTYPFSIMAVIDLQSILPAVTLLNPAFKLFRFVRLLRLTRVLKIFGISSKMRLFLSILYKECQVLSSVLVLALIYIFVTALILFNVEPHVNPYTHQHTFHSFFDALYWATVTLTTVGYGDICPVTDIGRFVSMLSSLFGVAVIALPSGVITARYLDELRKGKGRLSK